MTPIDEFIEAATVPREGWHASGTLDEAESLRPSTHNIYSAAVLGEDSMVRQFLAENPASATAKGGPHQWDPLTYLCFSRYLRIHTARSSAFVETARALLQAGANPNTGWIEMIDHPNPRPVLESAIYGAAGVAHNADLTRLLLEYGADPNDEETPYHAPEGYDNSVVEVLLASGKLNETSLACMLVRKADWHDEDGMRLILLHGADPRSALHHAILRDNARSMITLLLDHGADPTQRNKTDGRSAIEMAARRGRGDLLALFQQRGIPIQLSGLEHLIAACAQGDSESIREHPELQRELIAQGGTLLAEFASNGNVKGLDLLIDLGVSPSSRYEQGDPYFEIAKHSTALHVAAWRAWPAAVKLLIRRGAPVNAKDGQGRTALALAVKACVDSYWTNRRSPESVAALLEAGATLEGIHLPTGYDEVDQLLRARS